MIRRIIKIDEEKCNGCGLCADACHEGAIDIVGGKARLRSDEYCDGLGDCLPACPTNAISFEEREATAYSEAAVLAAKGQSKGSLPCSCPGTNARSINREVSQSASAEVPSMLRQWPVQIKLVPVNAQYFDDADLLIAADCTAYAYGNIHSRFIKGRITLIGCPKLDSVDYTEKLSAIIANNSIKSITVLRMEVPCCGGIELAAKRALQISGKDIPLDVVTISTAGDIL